MVGDPDGDPNRSLDAVKGEWVSNGVLNAREREEKEDEERDVERNSTS